MARRKASDRNLYYKTRDRGLIVEISGEEAKKPDHKAGVVFVKNNYTDKRGYYSNGWSIRGGNNLSHWEPISREQALKELKEELEREAREEAKLNF